MNYVFKFYKFIYIVSNFVKQKKELEDWNSAEKTEITDKNKKDNNKKDNKKNQKDNKKDNKKDNNKKDSSDNKSKQNNKNDNKDKDDSKDNAEGETPKKKKAWLSEAEYRKKKREERDAARKANKNKDNKDTPASTPEKSNKDNDKKASPKVKGRMLNVLTSNEDRRSSIASSMRSWKSDLPAGSTGSPCSAPVQKSPMTPRTKRATPPSTPPPSPPLHAIEAAKKKEQMLKDQEHINKELNDWNQSNEIQPPIVIKDTSLDDDIHYDDENGKKRQKRGGKVIF